MQSRVKPEMVSVKFWYKKKHLKDSKMEFAGSPLQKSALKFVRKAQKAELLIFYFILIQHSFRSHYVEYLGLLAWEHKLDPIPILTNDDLETIVKRACKKMPPRPYGTTEADYRPLLLKVRKLDSFSYETASLVSYLFEENLKFLDGILIHGLRATRGVALLNCFILLNLNKLPKSC